MDITRTTKVSDYSAIRVETPVVRLEVSLFEANVLRRLARQELIKPTHISRTADHERMVLRRLSNDLLMQDV